MSSRARQRRRVRRSKKLSIREQLERFKSLGGAKARARISSLSFDDVPSVDTAAAASLEAESILCSRISRDDLRARLRSQFLEADIDKSGTLDPTELRWCLQGCGLYFLSNEVSQIVTCADVNGDGLVDFNEFYSACFSILVDRILKELNGSTDKIPLLKEKENNDIGIGEDTMLENIGMGEDTMLEKENNNTGIREDTMLEKENNNTGIREDTMLEKENNTGMGEDRMVEKENKKDTKKGDSKITSMTTKNHAHIQAAIQLQHASRKYLLRKKITIVQCAWRRNVCAKQVKQIRSSIRIQSAWRRNVCAKQVQQIRSSIRIQCAWRRNVCAKQVQQIRSSIRIQCAWRCVLAKTVVYNIRRNSATTILQKIARGHRRRAKYIALKQFAQRRKERRQWRCLAGFPATIRSERSISKQRPHSERQRAEAKAARQRAKERTMRQQDKNIALPHIKKKKKKTYLPARFIEDRPNTPWEIQQLREKRIAEIEARKPPWARRTNAKVPAFVSRLYQHRNRGLPPEFYAIHMKEIEAEIKREEIEKKRKSK